VTDRFRHQLAVIRDIGFVAFGKYGQYLVTLITVPLCARILGPTGMGLLAVSMSGYFLGALITDMGITTFLAARVDEPDLDRLRGAYAAARLTMVALFGVAALVTALASVPQTAEMICLGLFGGATSAIGDDWVLLGKKRFGILVVQQGVGRVAYLLLLLALLPPHPDAEIAMLCLIASALIPVVWSWICTIRDYGPPARPSNTLHLLRTGGPVLAARLLVNTYEQGAATLFAPALSHQSLGLFTAGDRPVQAAGSLLDSIGWSLLPRMAARRDDHQDFWSASFRTAALVGVLGTLAAAAASSLAPWIVPLLFGEAFRGAIPLLQVEAWALPGMAVASFLATAILPVRQDTFGVVAGASIGAVIAVSALAWTFHTHQPMNVVIGIVAAESSVASFYLLRSRQLRSRAAQLEQTGAESV
jgi:O-antigen/teichoic acid export membrane protein